MNAMAIVLSVGIIMGLTLLLYGVFFQKEEKESGNKETLEQIKISVEEADTALSNINSVSSLVIEEIDIKYKELLFLYEVLEEKKKDLLENNSAREKKAARYDYETKSLNEEDYFEDSSVGSTEDSAYNADLEIVEIGRKMDEIKRFPRLKNRDTILEMHEKGYDVTRIAKELQIGRGEVQLIIGLSKVGAGYE